MWRRDKDGANYDLGHGLILRVWYESMKHLPEGAAYWNVAVFGKRLESRSETKADGKRRAERVGRRWLQEAQLRLSGSIS